VLQEVHQIGVSFRLGRIVSSCYLPWDIFSVKNDVLFLVRPKSNWRCARTTFGDLDVCCRLVCSSTQQDIISCGGCVHCCLDRSVGCSLRTCTRSGWGDIDIFAADSADYACSYGDQLGVGLEEHREDCDLKQYVEFEGYLLISYRIRERLSVLLKVCIDRLP
jgi:hypothetical protein